MKSAMPSTSYQLDQEISSFLKETQGTYLAQSPKAAINFQSFLSDKMLIIAAIRAGIPYSLFHTIQACTPFTETDWANFLDISTKSLQRYKVASNFSFKPIHSEKIIEMAEVTQAGLEVFDNLNTLKLWLNTPNFALGSLLPIELLKDSYGKDLVLAELIRINHGILA
jgi:putative toxin-antitoxin system antitoxin component (TIGR02293 family)